MGQVIQFIREWQRGFTDADAASATAKMNSPEAKRLDGIIEVTPAELHYLRSEYVAPPCDCA